MGYYMRFFTTSTEETTLSTIETALKRTDAAYSITNRISARHEAGTLAYEDGLYGQIEVNRTGDGLFGAEVEEFREEAEEAPGKGKETVLEALDATRAIVSIELLFQNRETEETLRRIDPIWHWLFENRSGLLQVDGEGWYDRSGRVLRVRV